MSTKRHEKIELLSDSEKINILLYGHPGAGKTRFIGTGPAKTLIIRPPVDHLNSIKNEARRGKHQWVVRSWTDMLDALEYLRERRGAGYEWVWLDSISLFQDTGLDDIWSAVLARKPTRGEYGLDKAEYGVNMFRLGQWVRHIVGMEQFNFGCTAHPAFMENPFSEDEENIEPIMMPYIQGKNMAPKICGYMNIVGYLAVNKLKDGTERRTLIARATERTYGKDQFDAIPNGRLTNPSIPRLIRLIGNQGG